MPLGYLLLDPSRCSTGSARRVTRTNIAQAGGEITHRKFKTGYVMELTMLVNDASKNGPACAATLRALGDLISLHLNAIDNADGRMVWSPSGAANRMLNPLRLLGPSGQGQTGFVTVVAAKDSESPQVELTFALLSPRPYAWDAAEIDTDLSDGVPATLTNAGSSEFHPVFKVFGPTSAFTLTNNSSLDEQGNPLQIVYDASLPGAAAIAGGHYAEIDVFRSTVYLDGDVANLKPGIDIPHSDFWTLLPGANDVEIVGADATVLWQAAWA